MLKNFNDLKKKLKEKPNKTVVIAAAHTESAIEAAILAKKENFSVSKEAGSNELWIEGKL